MKYIGRNGIEMRIVSLSSGSNGNCIYVGDDNTHVLIDAGVSAKIIENGLHDLDLSLNDIDAILVTHEHSDHIKGLGVLERKRFIPIYASPGTIEGIFYNQSLGKFDKSCLHSFENDEFIINSLSFTTHKISHDAKEPLCFSFTDGKKKGAVVTDLGKYDETLISELEGLNFILAEANHDIRMLETGPYAYSLKRRILSDRGHLCNENCGRFVASLLNDSFESIMIGHLSEVNNLPELAYESVKNEITMAPCKYEGLDFPIYVAKRNEISNIIDL